MIGEKIEATFKKKFRLAVNCDLATAWPFAVEGEAFAHRFFTFSRSLIIISIILLDIKITILISAFNLPKFSSKVHLSLSAHRFRAWVAPVLDSLLQHIR